jgi:hypothetical protein
LLVVASLSWRPLSGRYLPTSFRLPKKSNKPTSIFRDGAKWQRQHFWK